MEIERESSLEYMSPVHNLASLSPLTPSTPSTAFHSLPPLAAFHSLPQLTETAIATSVESAYDKILKTIVSYNGACMAISFIGIVVASGGQQSLINKEECNAGPIHAVRLMFFMLTAFVIFFLSTAFVGIVKVAIIFHGLPSVGASFRKMFNRQTIQMLVVLSLLGEVIGSVFMILSTSELIQIKVGLFSCGASFSIYTFLIFAFCMSVAVIGHVCMVGYGVYMLPILSVTKLHV